jgi:triosephosphate isomerase
VATERPEVIKQVIDVVSVPVLIGAGVHSGSDVKMGLKLGAVGILLASDIMLSNEPEKELRELAEAFRV